MKAVMEQIQNPLRLRSNENQALTSAEAGKDYCIFFVALWVFFMRI